MKSIQIQGAKKPVSQLIMGSDYFHPDKMDTVSEILDSYLEIGGNTIDTAYIYVGGNSEKAIGLWLQSRNNREKMNILTKGAHHNAQGPRVNREAIYEELMISLERLQTEYVDLYALHRDDPSVEVGRILEALNEHVDAGRIHAFGASNWTWKRLEDADKYASTHGLRGFSFSSPNLSLAKAIEPYWAGCVSADRETIDWHERTGLPVLSWSSQARGFFTGRYSPEDRSNSDLVRVFYNDDNWERYRRATVLAQKKQVTTIQIALAYVLNQSFPTCAIIGPQNQDEMISCQQGADISLNTDEIAWLDLQI
ncbi:aldo/keto reductase [Alicyclobacillus fastidiosus]|uniref:Aldo/keto reductase n=1 Tax=Alicyclobacillus fastidiosus TaxID=392011 RepID=A0ABY6ZMS7_9BACL|nr:aldo/keto reductase [Alicyclobacillus fastidiosus]WAH44146.1 aldo/keto reductase [Alicyclobacillus fastidiosus]GMA60450.1 oxidoreductase [Alicyclobacillus fastidiosus]